MSPLGHRRLPYSTVLGHTYYGYAWRPTDVKSR